MMMRPKERRTDAEVSRARRKCDRSGGAVSPSSCLTRSNADVVSRDGDDRRRAAATARPSTIIIIAGGTITMLTTRNMITSRAIRLSLALSVIVMLSERAEASFDMSRCPEILSEYQFELAVSEHRFDFRAVFRDDGSLACVRLDNGFIMPMYVNAAAALNWYSYTNRYDIVELLLNWSVSFPDDQDVNGVKPLHWAVLGDSHETASLLLERGASVDAIDISGFTPLHYAACSSDAEVALLLLQNRADIEAMSMWVSNKQKGGMTPLHFAGLCNNFQVAKLLLDWGAKVDVSDNSGRTPAQLARNNEASFELVRLLESSD